MSLNVGVLIGRKNRTSQKYARGRIDLDLSKSRQSSSGFAKVRSIYTSLMASRSRFQYRRCQSKTWSMSSGQVEYRWTMTSPFLVSSGTLPNLDQGRPHQSQEFQSSIRRGRSTIGSTSSCSVALIHRYVSDTRQRFIGMRWAKRASRISRPRCCAHLVLKRATSSE